MDIGLRSSQHPNYLKVVLQKYIHYLGCLPQDLLRKFHTLANTFVKTLRWVFGSTAGGKGHKKCIPLGISSSQTWQILLHKSLFWGFHENSFVFFTRNWYRVSVFQREIKRRNYMRVVCSLSGIFITCTCNMNALLNILKA